MLAAMSKAKSLLARQFEKHEEEQIKDYDPESLSAHSASDSESDGDRDESKETEHYVDVGSSKLRSKQAATLGPKYKGARISRAALDKNHDDEDDEDERFANRDDISDSESTDDGASLIASTIPSRAGYSSRSNAGIKKRPTAADFLLSDIEENNSDTSINTGDQPGNLGNDDDDEISRQGSELSDDDSVSHGDFAEGVENEDESDDDVSDSEADEATAKPSKLLKSSTTATERASSQQPFLSIGQAVPKDALKGEAIRKQRKIFDGLLNIRIRLQKAMISANTFHAVANDNTTSQHHDQSQQNISLDDAQAFEAAEEAAIKLWNTIGSLRDTMYGHPDSQIGEKRKRGHSIQISTSSTALWETLKQQDLDEARHREKILEKWSAKLRGNDTKQSSRLSSNTNKALTVALQEQLAEPGQRLVKRSRVPRSCAPVQAMRKVAQDNDIYDDADFYQLLLKELVDQRTVEATTQGAQAGMEKMSEMVRGVGDIKIRKEVDRKASKGRKLRFTVHDKLQNFMAPEDRGVWEQEAVDRLFGTLFGQRLQLNEDNDSDNESVDEEQGQLGAEEAGLRLFRA